MKKTVLASMVAATTLGFLTPLSSHAFGLGKINVHSALNEPFKAEIPVASLRPEEKGNLQVRIASEAEFNKAGLERSMLLNQMQFDIVERGQQDLILITSKQAIKEPFIDFLITATAGSGLMLREYTVLLDPPEYVMAETRGTSASSSPAPQRDDAVAQDSSSKTRYQYAESTGFSGSSYDVKRSDTLWNVALKTRPDSNVSVHQMMMALLEANPDAFTNRNVNGLKAGVSLQIPSRSEMTALSRSAAIQAFAEQNQAWANRNKSSSTVVQAESTPSETASAEEATTDTVTQSKAGAAGDDAATAETEMAATDSSTAAGETQANADARLQLVAPEEDVSSEDDAAPNVTGNDEIQQLTEQLTLAQETIEAQAQENIDFKSRMDAMEEQLETMRRLISLKDADMARLQSMLEEEDPALAAQAAATLEADSEQSETGDTGAMSESDADESVSDSDVINDSATGSEADATPELDPQPEAEQTQGAEEAGATTQQTVSEQEDGLIKQAANALNLDPAQVQSTFDKVKQFVADNKMPTVLGLLLALLLLWLMARRSRREVTWDEAVKKMDKHDDKVSAGAAVVATAREDEETDAPLSHEQVDQEKTVGELVEQADMFVGYADYVQARSSLEQARNLEPANTLVAYKLLFVLYKQDQAEEFVELAQQSEFDKDSFEWNEIKQWGQTLAPGHALFEEPVQSQPEAQTNDEEVVAAPDFESELAQSDEADTSEETVETEAADDSHIEFDLNDFADTKTPQSEETESKPEQETKPETDTDDDLLAFDTHIGRDDKSETADIDEPLELDINDDTGADETLSFDEEIKPVPLESDADETEQVDLDDSEDAPDLEFDIGDLDDIDEAETKLDLAAAYVDMGDPDGARSILNEVLVEGNDEQKNRAHELLNSLS